MKTPAGYGTTTGASLEVFRYGRPEVWPHPFQFRIPDGVSAWLQIVLPVQARGGTFGSDGSPVSRDHTTFRWSPAGVIKSPVCCSFDEIALMDSGNSSGSGSLIRLR